MAITTSLRSHKNSALASSDTDANVGTSTPTSRVRHGVLMLVAAILLGVLAPLLVTASPATAATRLPSRTSTEMSISKTIRNLINAERARHGLPPVHMNRDLMNSAREHDVAMAQANTMSHQLRGEAAFGTRMDRAGYHWTWAGENIAWNSNMTAAGVIQLEKLMYAEHAPDNGHRLNILGKHFRNVGVDVYLDRANHKIWLTTDFGHL